MTRTTIAHQRRRCAQFRVKVSRSPLEDVHLTTNGLGLYAVAAGPCGKATDPSTGAAWFGGPMHGLHLSIASNILKCQFVDQLGSSCLMGFDLDRDLTTCALVRSEERKTAENSRDRQDQCHWPDPDHFNQNEDEQQTPLRRSPPLRARSPSGTGLRHGTTRRSRLRGRLSLAADQTFRTLLGRVQPYGPSTARASSYWTT